MRRRALLRACLTKDVDVFGGVAVSGHELHDRAAIWANFIEIAAFFDKELHETRERFGDHAAVGFQQDVIVGLLARLRFERQEATYALVAPPFVGDSQLGARRAAFLFRLHCSSSIRFVGAGRAVVAPPDMRRLSQLESLAFRISFTCAGLALPLDSFIT